MPLFVAAIGIILRGGAYALRPGMHDAGERRAVETVFSVSSILTPFALGAMLGGVAAGRVPVGNAAGDLISSWWNPLAMMVGLLSVATSAYLAAVFLSADAVRLGEPDLEARFRRRALVAGVVAGAAAAAGLVALRSDAHRVYEHLLFGRGIVALVVSGRGRRGDARPGRAQALRAVALHGRPGGRRHRRRLGAGAVARAPAGPDGRSRRRHPTTRWSR